MSRASRLKELLKQDRRTAHHTQKSLIRAEDQLSELEDRPPSVRQCAEGSHTAVRKRPSLHLAGSERTAPFTLLSGRARNLLDDEDGTTLRPGLGTGLRRGAPDSKTCREPVRAQHQPAASSPGGSAVGSVRGWFTPELTLLRPSQTACGGTSRGRGGTC